MGEAGRSLRLGAYPHLVLLADFLRDRRSMASRFPLFARLLCPRFFLLFTVEAAPLAFGGRSQAERMGRRLAGTGHRFASRRSLLLSRMVFRRVAAPQSGRAVPLPGGLASVGMGLACHSFSGFHAAAAVSS